MTSLRWISAWRSASRCRRLSSSIFSRVSMDKPKGENMTPENLFGVLTVMSFLWALPFALVLEGPKAAAMWAAAAIKTPPAAMVSATVATGMYFYTYNEVPRRAPHTVRPMHACARASSCVRHAGIGVCTPVRVRGARAHCMYMRRWSSPR